jgi:lysosomal Pro-X carboxypeptidase
MPAQFLGDLPAYPVNATCQFFNAPNMSDIDLVRASRKAADLFYNASEWIVPGQGTVGPCHNPAVEQGIASLGAGPQWPYQSCTEMVMPIGQKGPPNDFFYPAKWDLAAIIANCQQQFGVTPRPYWILQQFGGRNDWKDATNIVFSNGNLDPWSGGGVLQSINPTVVAIEVVGGAHHLDLRASTPDDIKGVIEARAQEVEWIQRFLDNPTGVLSEQDFASDQIELS